MTNALEKGSELAATTNQFFDLYNFLSLRCCTNYNICIYSRYNTLSFHHTWYDTFSQSYILSLFRVVTPYNDT
jgi:hypothetical protein